VPWQGRLLADQKANKVLDAYNVEVSIWEAMLGDSEWRTGRNRLMQWGQRAGGQTPLYAASAPARPAGTVVLVYPFREARPRVGDQWSKNVPSISWAGEHGVLFVPKQTRGMGCSRDSRNATTTGRCDKSEILTYALGCLSRLRTVLEHRPLPLRACREVRPETTCPARHLVRIARAR
jgi:hypothetical protein